MFIQRKRNIMAETDVDITPEASDLLFEADDVAELVAEVTGEPVEVTADAEEVTFAVGEGETAEEYTVTADGDEEILEAVRKPLRGKAPLAASRRVSAARRRAARPVKSSRTIRKVPKSRK